MQARSTARLRKTLKELVEVLANIAKYRENPSSLAGLLRSRRSNKRARKRGIEGFLLDAALNPRIQKGDRAEAVHCL